eukprot:COSAG05_NODE_26611_length_186_cov_17.356322_1_plen_47_part_10
MRIHQVLAVLNVKTSPPTTHTPAAAAWLGAPADGRHQGVWWRPSTDH